MNVETIFETIFETLTEEEMRRVLRHVPLPARLALRTEGAVLAGGVIRDAIAGLPVKDVDIFCRTQEQAERIALMVSPFVRKTTFAYSVELGGTPVQFIFYKEFRTPEELISQFDFRACCAGIYWNGTEWRGVAVKGFRQDCQDRILRFMSQKKDESKLTALRRALNFAQKGWTISDDDLAAIVTHWQPTITREHVKRSFRPAYGRA